MKFIGLVIVLLSCLIQNVRLQDPIVIAAAPPSCDPSNNEEYTACGNLCEDSCANTCDASEFLSFGSLTSSPLCKAGCYCKTGYIRTNEGTCEKNRVNACGE
jgi:hypothetical protein